MAQHIDNPSCWCNPDVVQICPVCLGVGTHPADQDVESSPPCPQCNGTGAVKPYNAHEPLSLIHKAG